MKEKKRNDFERDFERKIVLVKGILNNVYEIMNIFKPLFDLMLEMEEAKIYKKNGTFEKAANLFGEISEYCRELEGSHSLSN
jgi:hypothetical protein